MVTAGKVYFLFIASHLMQNPIGCCYGWLKIAELAQGFTDSHSINVSPETFCINCKGFF